MRLDLSLFPEGTSAEFRRDRLVFLAVWIWVAIMVASPLVIFMGKASPLIFGLPMGLAWVLAAVALIFFALLALYIREPGAGDLDDAERRD